MFFRSFVDDERYYGSVLCTSATVQLGWWAYFAYYLHLDVYQLLYDFITSGVPGFIFSVVVLFMMAVCIYSVINLLYTGISLFRLSLYEFFIMKVVYKEGWKRHLLWVISPMVTLPGLMPSLHNPEGGIVFLITLMSIVMMMGPNLFCFFHVDAALRQLAQAKLVSTFM